MHRAAGPRLERSCAGDWIRTAPACPDIERIEAFFSGHAFDPHRHDTYAIGYTVDGVQSFRYRGADRHSLPGRVIVLHPDETHDGHAGTAAGFRYRIAYVRPQAVRAALGETRALPFVRAAVSEDRRLAAAIIRALDDLDRPLDDLECAEIIYDIAGALAGADASFAARGISAGCARAVSQARELLDAHFVRGVSSAALEAATGLTRYEAARQFRAVLGTSPYRYLTMRRLDRARCLIARGSPLADAAAASGFADQSHMTRQFKKAYGLAPGRWAGLVGAA